MSPKSDSSSSQPEAAASGPTVDLTDIPDMGYEAARNELIEIVRTLDSAQVPLEKAMAMAQRGEALADHCERWLAGASGDLPESD